MLVVIGFFWMKSIPIAFLPLIVDLNEIINMIDSSLLKNQKVIYLGKKLVM